MLKWLLEIGCDPNESDDFGQVPLQTAAEYGNLQGVKLLLSAGADPEAEYNGQTALGLAGTREIVDYLLDAGTNPGELTFESRRAFLGLPSEADPNALLEITSEQYLSGRSPRFGQTLTRLPDGTVVEIGGEHEDSYDRDFCIYNDVFVHGSDGSIAILGYPEATFPPTDFHTATYIGNWIYIIGGHGICRPQSVRHNTRLSASHPGLPYRAASRLSDLGDCLSPTGC